MRHPGTGPFVGQQITVIELWKILLTKENIYFWNENATIKELSCISWKKRWSSWSQTDHDFCLHTKLTQNAVISTRLEHIHFNSKCFLWVTGFSNYGLNICSRYQEAGMPAGQGFKLKFSCFLSNHKITLQTTFWYDVRIKWLAFVSVEGATAEISVWRAGQSDPGLRGDEPTVRTEGESVETRQVR